MGYRPGTPGEHPPCLPLSLIPHQHLQNLRRRSRNRNQITRGLGCEGGDEKQSLSLFPSVAVACNSSFTELFLACGLGTTSVVLNFFIRRL